MSEQWAFCDRCDRWFYAERAERHGTAAHCPVCDGSPVAVREHRPCSVASAS